MLQDMQNNMGGSFRGDPSGGRSESPVYNRMLEEQQFNSMGQQPYGQQGVAAIQEKRANMGMPNAGPQGSPAQGFANGMDPELLQQVAQMMQSTQGQGGGMPPRPAGKTVRPPSPSANSNIRGPADYGTDRKTTEAVNNAAQMGDDPGFGTSGGKYPGSRARENPEVQQLSDIRNRAQYTSPELSFGQGEWSGFGGYNQSGPINSRTPAGGAGSDIYNLPPQHMMALQQNGYTDVGAVRYFLNDYGEIETKERPGYEGGDRGAYRWGE
tara:strand:- start:2317 stop:3120 length:804 start_codon:yes stop_codon:yes gene_type:complete